MPFRADLNATSRNEKQKCKNQQKIQFCLKMCEKIKNQFFVSARQIKTRDLSYVLTYPFLIFCKKREITRF